jgi:hypothetical protein
MMTTKYGTEIDNEIVIKNIKRLINQTYKLLPNREEGVDWETPLSTIIEELCGMASLMNFETGSDIFTLLCKLEGLKKIDKEDFFNFRRTIFESLNLMNKVKEYVSNR